MKLGRSVRVSLVDRAAAVNVGPVRSVELEDLCTESAHEDTVRFVIPANAADDGRERVVVGHVDDQADFERCRPDCG